VVIDRGDLCSLEQAMNRFVSKGEMSSSRTVGRAVVV
jgi:hypothetical protein